MWKGELLLWDFAVSTIFEALAPSLKVSVGEGDCKLMQLAICAGLSRSEGGFKENKVSSASVLDVQAANDKKGKPYYKYEILTRTGGYSCRDNMYLPP